jgi:hypothetical protein
VDEVEFTNTLLNEVDSTATRVVHNCEKSEVCDRKQHVLASRWKLGWKRQTVPTHHHTVLRFRIHVDYLACNGNVVTFLASLIRPFDASNKVYPTATELG